MYTVGIDLGGTNIKAGIVNEKYQIIVQDSVPTNTGRPYQEIISDMADLVLGLLQKASLNIEEIKGIGIGSPGTVDAKRGVILYSNNFGWEDIPLRTELEKLFSCPIRITNDANCAALGEVKAGAATAIENAILLTLGTGVGGGIIINGQVFEGAHAGGAELGHTSLVYNGEPCTCGRKGCVEAYVSANALIREAQNAAIDHPDSMLKKQCNGKIEDMNGKIPFDCAFAGDKVARNVIDHYILYLSETIINFINIFRPDVVLLSGGVCNQGENLTNPINAYIKDKCFAHGKAFIPPVKCAILGNNAGIIGAASLLI